MMTGLALRPSWPDVGEVTRSLLGVVLAVAVALHWGSTAAAIAAGASAAIAGSTAFQDGPRGRLPLLVAVSGAMGAAVFLGALSARHAAIFVVVVALWCLVAGLVWTLGRMPAWSPRPPPRCSSPRPPWRSPSRRWPR